MKEYKITIQIEEVKKSNSYMSKILEEVEQEKKELKIAEDLNGAAGKIRGKYFKELLDTINEELSCLGIKEFNIEEVSLGDNKIPSFSSSSVWIGDEYVKVLLEPHYDVRPDYPTRYTTSTKDFSIIIRKAGSNSSPLKSDDILGDFFDRIKRNIKLHLHKN